MLDSVIYRACMLAQWGYSGKAIQAACVRYDGAWYSTGHIYAMLRKRGIRIKDYRDGESSESQAHMRSLFPGERPARKMVRPKPRPRPKKKKKRKAKRHVRRT